MPNGRSGGFLIETSDLKQLIAAVSDAIAVGGLTTGARPRPASAAEISRCLEKCRHDHLAVEEQNKTFYIVHISDEPSIIWVSVASESPIFAELRERHSRWMAEHPGWNGWIGF